MVQSTENKSIEEMKELLVSEAPEGYYFLGNFKSMIETAPENGITEQERKVIEQVRGIDEDDAILFLSNDDSGDSEWRLLRSEGEIRSEFEKHF